LSKVSEQKLAKKLVSGISE